MIPGPENGSELDQIRTARLLFDVELASGVAGAEDLHSSEVLSATRVPRIPARPLRVAQQVRYKLGRLGYERDVVGPLMAARATVLGRSSDVTPRFLVRVDEFPHYRAWDDRERFGARRFERFHEILAEAGVPYLLAVLPRVSREPLSSSDLGSRPLEDEERAMLARLVAERVSFALHGLTHRTRFASPRRHSELCGLGPEGTVELLDGGLAELASLGVSPPVFVPPYNRFDASQFAALAQRFQIVCGGPESIGLVGFQDTPQWRGETVYLPSYAPFYGHAAEVLPAVEGALGTAAGLWIPIVLHWGWEAEAGWRDLERLVSVLAPHAVAWEEFLAAVGRSREGDASNLAESEPGFVARGKWRASDGAEQTPSGAVERTTTKTTTTTRR
jgi:Uncharacterized protein conserved in bacteria (DUF2334)